MSNTPANNLPDNAENSRANDADAVEPEPSRTPSNPNSIGTNLPGTLQSEMRSGELRVEIAWDRCVQDAPSALGIDDNHIIDAVVAAAEQLGFCTGEIGVRLTDDPTIHQFNAKHLSHDYPTDVISFPYSDDVSRIEGELIASVDTARQNALLAGWETSNELLLYVIHGVLHIGGMEDHGDDERAEMREAERAVLMRLGIDAGPAAEGRTDE